VRVSRRARALEDRLVWILGSPRSGSTWLLNLLRWHPRVVGIDEPLIGAHLGVHKSDVAPSTEGRYEGPPLVESEAGRPSYVFSERFEDAWRPALGALILERFAAEVGERSGGSGRPFVAIKEPNGSHAASVLFRVLPKSRLLFLARDARDVVDSALDMAVAFGEPRDRGRASDEVRRAVVTEASQQWVARIEAVRRLYDRLPDDRRLFMKYEELRTQPEPHVLRAFSWLGIDVAPDEVAAACQRLAFENLPAEDRGSGKFHRAATPGLWRTNLTETEQELVSSVTSELNAELGYGDT
jgi:hypothetical protein